MDGEGAAGVICCAEHYGATAGGIGPSGGINNSFRYKESECEEENKNLSI